MYLQTPIKNMSPCEPILNESFPAHWEQSLILMTNRHRFRSFESIFETLNWGTSFSRFAFDQSVSLTTYMAKIDVETLDKNRRRPRNSWIKSDLLKTFKSMRSKGMLMTNRLLEGCEKSSQKRVVFVHLDAQKFVTHEKIFEAQGPKIMSIIFKTFWQHIFKAEAASKSGNSSTSYSLCWLQYSLEMRYNLLHFVFSV